MGDSSEPRSEPRSESITEPLDNTARELAATLASLGLPLVVGAGQDALIVYARNRTEARRARDAIGASFRGHPVTVVRTGRARP